MIYYSPPGGGTRLRSARELMVAENASSKTCRKELVDRQEVPDKGVPNGLIQSPGSGSSAGREFEPRTKRALTEEMDISLLKKGGTYEVNSESGNTYVVDLLDSSCSCPDWQKRKPENGCKHMRRVHHEVKNGLVPRPDGKLPN